MSRAALLMSLASLLGACAGSPSNQTPQISASGDMSRQILLTVEQDTASSAIALNGPPGRRYLRRRGYNASPQVERTLNALAREHGLRRVQGWPIGSLEVYCEVFEVPDAMSVDAVIEQLADDPRIDLVQRMNLFETLLSRYDDPYGELQSAVQDLGVEQAHSLATGRGVTVAVIDSGVDTEHPDLDGRVSVAHDLVESPEALRHGEVHGTAVAGIIVSVANNNEGIIGVAPGADVAALRACWPSAGSASHSHCSSYTLARALEIAVTIEPQIINLSLAGPFDPLLSRLLDKAIEQGSVIVAAYSERDDSDAVFPASHPRVIVAHAPETTADLSVPYALAAPAVEILTTVPDAGYAFLSGNSLAAAHVSGVIALLMEMEPGIDVEDLAGLLATTSVSSGSSTTIHACRALAKLIDRDICDAQIASF